MAEFTPGPWMFVHGHSFSDMAPRVLTGDNRHALAMAFLTGDKRSETNARLMAAAPELLDALIIALPYVETAETDPAYKPGSVAKVVKQMRAAIAKATGEAA